MSRPSKPAQELVQRAEHLLGEPGRDLGLRVAARLQQRGKAARLGVVEQAKGIEQQLEPAQHRPAGDGRERADRPGDPAGGLAARGVDEADLLVPDENAGADAALAQQPLETLVRRRLPAVSRAALAGIDVRRLDGDQELPAVGAGRGLQRPIGLEQRIVLGQSDCELVVERRPAGRAGDQVDGPIQHAGKERPGIGERRALVPDGAVAVLLQQRRNGGVVRLILARRRAERLQRHRCDDQALGLDVAQPFGIGIERAVVGHCRRAQPVTGQRKRSPTGSSRCAFTS